MSEKRFDPAVFLSKVGPRTTIVECRRNHTLFRQGDVAEAVFFLRKGKIKLTVASKSGKEAVIGVLGDGRDHAVEGQLFHEQVSENSASSPTTTTWKSTTPSSTSSSATDPHGRRRLVNFDQTAHPKAATKAPDPR